MKKMVIEVFGGEGEVKEETMKTNEGMRDAYWEVSEVLGSRKTELEMLRENDVSSKEITVIEAAFDAVAAATEGLQGGEKGVKCMDTWVGVFGG